MSSTDRLNLEALFKMTKAEVFSGRLVKQKLELVLGEAHSANQIFGRVREWCFTGLVTSSIVVNNSGIVSAFLILMGSPAKILG